MSGDVVEVGIDENGLGPRLGPLIVTAVAARVHASATSRRAALLRPRGRLRERIGDSKDLISFGDSALGEAWARVLSGIDEGPDAVVAALAVDARTKLREPCPDDHAAQCWNTEGEGWEAPAELSATLRADRARLERRGLEILGAHVAIVCTRRLNESAARGVSRFEVDLHAMERLMLHVRDLHGTEIDATCGKVGGYHSYPAVFGPLSGRLVAVVEEGRARSEYSLPGLGRVAFVRDADASHLLVSLASLVGKWVRDLLTRRVTRYHRAHEPSLPEASGYHDPITARFVAASALSRRARGVPDDCFERRAREGKGAPRA
jgi:ribonuclease HII